MNLNINRQRRESQSHYAFVRCPTLEYVLYTKKNIFFTFKLVAKEYFSSWIFVKHLMWIYLFLCFVKYGTGQLSYFDLKFSEYFKSIKSFHSTIILIRWNISYSSNSSVDILFGILQSSNNYLTFRSFWIVFPT